MNDTKMTPAEAKLATEIAKVVCPDVKDPLLTKEDAEAGDYGIHVSIGRKSQYALPTTDDPLVAEITYCDEYNAEITYEGLELIAEICGSRKINLGEVEGLSSGCDTCGNGSSYRVKVFVIDPVIA